MRTTIRLDDALLADAKAVAARTGRTLTAVIEDALRESLARSPEGPRADRPLPVYDGDGLVPGIDLDDTAGLLSVMDEHR